MAWRKLPAGEGKTTVLTGIRQKNRCTRGRFCGEIKRSFVEMFSPSVGTEMLLKQLAWENASSLCKELIRPIRKTRSRQDYIKACIDASPAVVI